MARASLITAAIAVGVAAAAASAAAPPVPYPNGYRQWTHVKSMVIEPGHALYDAFGGLHHIYANAAAIDGYRRGRHADGAVIVFDLLEAKSADHAIVEGARKVVGVMLKDSKRYAATGGWGFEAWKGDSRSERVVGANAADACFGCHAPQRARDYVFSTFRR
jgi:hypothetical protein